MRKTFLICLSLFISACSTYSKRECQTMNWSQAGVQTALDGKPLQQGLSHYNKECLKENGIQPDEQALRYGYEMGLKQFCTPEHSYKFARKGGQYAGICSAADEAVIRPKLHEGRMGYLEQKVEELSRQVSKFKSDVDSLESKLSSTESRLRNAESDLRSCKSGH